MKISDYPNIHLTYCLNIHSGETWDENFHAIKTIVTQVRDKVSSGKSFGLGMRLSRQAAETLRQEKNLYEFKRFLAENAMYVFTINGFPYGTFHGSPVKKDVYLPDWRTDERLDYTKMLADILVELLPEGVKGSISTVPGGYKEYLSAPSDVSDVVSHLVSCASYLADLALRTGKIVNLGLEPEPDCFLETTREVVTFFEGSLMHEGGALLSDLRDCSLADAMAIIKRHIGVCFDTCHMAIQFEELQHSIELLNAKDILISKIQLSAAIKINVDLVSTDRINVFNDPVYLHQVKSMDCMGAMESFADLPEALAVRDVSCNKECEWRIHCHVPLYFKENQGVYSTADVLHDDFFACLSKMGIEHLEIETYTFDVLPQDIKEQGVVESIVREYEWVLSKFQKKQIS